MALIAVLGMHLCGRTVTVESALPFGPVLAVAIWLVWLCGPVAVELGVDA